MLAILLCALCMSPVAGLQTDNPVSTAIAAIDTAIDNVIGGWEVRIESNVSEGQEPTEPWKTVRLGHSSREKQIRYRTTLTIPSVHAGTKITGGKATLRLSLGGPSDYTAKVSINGKHILDLPIIDPVTREHMVPPITLSENATPGEKYVIEVLINNRLIYPPHEFLDASKSVSIYPAHFTLAQSEELVDELSRLRINLKAGLEMSSEWKSNPNDSRPFVPALENRSKIDPAKRESFAATIREGASKLDIEALKSGDAVATKQSIHAVYAALQPASAYAKSFTIYLIGNAHIDLAWLWRTIESATISANTFRSVFNNLEVHPELIFAQSQAQAYQWVKDNNPDVFAKMQQGAKDGSWDIVGGMWVESDCNVPSGESWVRQMLYAQNFFQENFGVTATLGWNPDSFGYNWNMPQFFSKAGIKAFITQKISWNHQTRFPYHLFWWEAPDGSRVLAYMPTGGYTEKAEPDRMVEQMLHFEYATGIPEMLHLIGFGDHGGGPNLPMLDRAAMLADQPIFPKVQFLRATEFIDKIRKEYDLSDLPVWKSEMYLENHRGTLTSQAHVKKNNRKIEALLETTEKAASIAELNGMAYPAEEIERAWKILLLNQFHDILPGSSITPVYNDAKETYALARKILNRALSRSIKAIAGGIHSKEGSIDSLVVFNPLSWQRDDVVKIAFDHPEIDAVTVKDENGTIMPSYIETSEDGLDRYLVFRANGVPSVGIKPFWVYPGGEAGIVKTSGGLTIENEFLRVTVNAESGNISSIYDKANSREVIAEGKEGNVIQLHENIPSYWDAWNIGYTDNSWTLDKADSVELIEANELRSIIRVKKSFLGFSKANRNPTEGFPSSFFVQDITLYRGSPRVDVKMSIDWWEDHTLLKVAFPFAVDSDTVIFEIPYATIERSTRKNTEWEKARYEVSVHRWADMSNDGYGVSLLNDRKYGMDVTDNVMRLTLLTSPLWPDPFADRGRQEVVYSIYPHAGSWQDADTIHQAQQLNLPLIPLRMDSGENATAATSSYFSVDAENVFVATIKRTENAEGYILRIVESEGKAGRVTVKLPFSAATANEVDLLENRIDGVVDIDGKTISFELGPHEVKSVKVTAAKGR